MEERGNVRISPSVLAAVAGQAATSVSGVVRLGSSRAALLNRLIGPARRLGILGGQVTRGVHAQTDGESVWLEVDVVVQSGANLLEVAAQVQQEVANAVASASGLTVRNVDVHIQDVE